MHVRISEIANALAPRIQDGRLSLGVEAEELFERFHTLVTAAPDKAAENAAPELGKLAAFSGVCEFPVRVKCATLAWHTFRAALHGEAQAVSTE